MTKDIENLNNYQIARIVAVDKNSYIVTDGHKDAYAELTGKFMFSVDASMDYPTVGDFVSVQFFNEGTFAIIHEVLQRKSVIKRKSAGKKIEFQLIAANIDTALIMQSLDSNYNLRRLERYMAIVNESNIKPVVLLSKSDLLTSQEIENKKNEIHNLMPNIQIVFCNNKDDLGLDAVKDLFESGKTYCLLGSSGVGKTTLLNNLLREELFQTQAVREKDGKGKHTTTRRQLVVMDNGAMLIDTPGMRELGIIALESGLNETFAEIAEFIGQCRYSDCTHTVEKDCAVLLALKEGKIEQDRYDNYIKMYKESVYNEMSYQEKRQKDKQFGKFCNTALKQIKKLKNQ